MSMQTQIFNECKANRSRPDLPNNEYWEYYGPDYELDVRSSNMTDQNTPEYLQKVTEAVFEVLRDKNAAPSVPLQSIPKMMHDDEDEDEGEDNEDRDVRRPGESLRTSCLENSFLLLTLQARLWAREKQHETSLSDSEDEGTGGRRHRRSYKESAQKNTMVEGTMMEDQCNFRVNADFT